MIELDELKIGSEEKEIAFVFATVRLLLVNKSLTIAPFSALSEIVVPKSLRVE